MWGDLQGLGAILATKCAPGTLNCCAAESSFECYKQGVLRRAAGAQPHIQPIEFSGVLPFCNLGAARVPPACSPQYRSGGCRSAAAAPA